jgi:hypothetical protein
LAIFFRNLIYKRRRSADVGAKNKGIARGSART